MSMIKTSRPAVLCRTEVLSLINSGSWHCLLLIN